MSDEEDRPQQTTERNKTLTGGLFRRWLRRWQATDSSSSPTLPPDPADLLGQSNPHWAGNINVLIGHTAVERHRAAALKIYAGRTNVAALFVGDGRVDQYRFELSGQGAEWNTRLTDFRELPNLRRRGPIHELKLGSWLSVPRRYSIAVLIEPPDYVAAGELKVHVTRKSTGETAIVEFSLDPKAQGPGCYAL